MSDDRHARALLALARIDFKSLTGMNNIEIFADSVFGFHAQQAVEKGIKAWLTFLNVCFPKTHDLRKLMAMLEAHCEEDLEEWWPLIEYNPFAVQLRYHWPEMVDAPLDRAESIQRIGQFLDRIEQHIQSHDSTRNTHGASLS
ncbi:MAG: HEPN domain-containing protein [Magnetococcales bacterium]|nr:HEPN domain-containing protein [Magnetococcales bacterium]NGZ07507.1 HEPN domain-containing protein [Magnetococcales bacterium]